MTARFRLGDRVKLRPAAATGRFWAYKGAVGIVVETVQLPGPLYRVAVSFQARYLGTLEDQDESLFELAGPNRPR